MHWVVVINSKLIALILLSFTASCGKDIPIGDQLSKGELDYLRTRAAKKCMGETESIYSNFEKRSNDNMLRYVVSPKGNTTWRYDTKQDTVTTEESLIHIWKVAAPDAYFLLSLDEKGTTRNLFVKISTDINIDMIRNLQKKKCDKELNFSDSESYISGTIEGPKINGAGTTYSIKDTEYRISSDYPAFFGYLNRKETKRIYKSNDVLDKTVVYDHVITAADATPLPESYKAVQNREYCVVKYSSPRPPETLDVYEFPFELECTKDSKGPDANGDNVSDFNPAVELCLKGSCGGSEEDQKIDLNSEKSATGESDSEELDP